MIHLDTNLLIGVGDAADIHHAAARSVFAKSIPVAASAPAWTEYQSRPLTTALARGVRAMLHGGVIPFDEAAAVLAGRLFCQTGNRRRNRLDTMIAASAILAGAELATMNPADFEPFAPHGLKLLFPPVA
jgi:predicted nucleic acid-binding protein